MNATSANPPFRLQPQDYLAVLMDLLLHRRETTDLLRLSPDDFDGAARLSCAALGNDTAPFAHELAQRFCFMFGLNSEEAPSLDPAAPFGQWAEALCAAMNGRPQRIGFLTSGSTGVPGLRNVPFAALEQELRVFTTLASPSRVCSVMPRYHCFGFVYGILLPRYAGLPQRAFLPMPTAELTGHLQPGDLLVGFPFFFDALARMQTDLAGVMPLTAGSPCPPQLADALITAGADGVREIYGASELSAVGFRHIRRTGEAETLPFTLLPQWELGDGTLTRRLDDGSADAPAPLPDSLEWRGERQFSVVARHDKAVQVGGRNVYPERVRAALQEHPAVSDCRVRLMRPDEGWRLKAFVVPAQPLNDEKEAMNLRAALLAWCRERLPSESVPKAFTFGPELPRNEYGKDADWK